MSFDDGLMLGLMLGGDGGGSGGDEKWHLPENWIPIPEPGQKQIVMLIEIAKGSENNINNPALAFGSQYDIEGIGSIDWGDGYIDIVSQEKSQEHSGRYTHIYSQAGLYIITITLPVYISGSFFFTSPSTAHVSGDMFPGGEAIYTFTTMQTAKTGWVRAIKLGNDAYVSNNVMSTDFGQFGGLVYLKYCGNSFDYVSDKRGLHTSNRGLCKIDFENLPTEIPESMCASCYSLKEADFVRNVKDIPNSAFSNCYGLKSVDLSSAETLGTNAFSLCYQLKEINAPKVTSIANAFSNCFGLRKILASSLLSLPTGMFTNFAYNIVWIDTPSLIDVPSGVLNNFSSLQKFTYANNCDFHGYNFLANYNLYPKPE